MANSPTLIAGTVHDNVGKAVAGAVVSFVASPVSVPDIAALTTAKGDFGVTAPTPGTYLIAIRADGYAPKTVAVEVTGQASQPINITLDPVGGALRPD